MIDRARRQRRRRVAAVAAIAAAVAAVAALPLIPRPRSEGPGEDFYSVVAEAGHHPEAINRSSPGPSLSGEGIARGPSRPAATFVSGGDAIVVPMASSSGDVTVVQVFQTVGAQQRLQAVATLTSLTTEPYGG